MNRRVALVLNLSKDFDRKIASGVAAHARDAQWSVYLEDDPALRVPRLPEWRGDGIIANLDDAGLARALSRLRIPIVGVGGGFGGRTGLSGAPYVASDESSIGRMAAEHLLACGFRHLAYCGYRRDGANGWSMARGASFLKSAREAGARTSALDARVGDPRRWNAMIGEVQAWLKSLAGPVGLMAADDMRARHVLQAARQARLHVPRELAVVGVDNDHLACGLASPPLTSIEQDAEGIGRIAAETLDRMFRGKNVDGLKVVPPLRLESRLSTRVHLDDDPLVEQSLTYVSDHLAEGIQAGEVARACGVSLVTLNKHFRASKRCTVFDWIHQERLKEARRLIQESRLPLTEIARRSGIGSPSYLCHLVRKTYRVRPADLRRV